MPPVPAHLLHVILEAGRDVGKVAGVVAVKAGTAARLTWARAVALEFLEFEVAALEALVLVRVVRIVAHDDARGAPVPRSALRRLALRAVRCGKGVEVKG